MGRFIHFLILFLIVIISFIGCEDNQDDIPAVNTSVIMPLTVGNSWQYYEEVFDSVGNLESANPAYLNIQNDTTINSSRWYNLNDGTSVQNSDSGILRDYMNNNGLFYMFPANGGEQYVWVTDTITVKAQFLPVQVGAGTFTCYKYAIASPSAASFDTLYDYLAPGYGLILREWTYNLSNGSKYLSRRWSLLSYKIYR